MLGANPASVLVGAVYVDAGATALDDKDGNITNRIATSGLPINTNAVGSYLVTYTVSDQAGNQAVPVVRTVNVVNVPPPPDTTPPVITMLGANPASVLVGAVYVDAGATALDDKDGNITNRIATSGLPINTNAVGSYLVTYTVSDQAGNQAVPVVRTVNVVNVPPPPDTTPPVITMLGANPASVLVGAVYVDAGATALDDKDGNITNRIATSGLPINTNAPGSFTVAYHVTDQAGNPASAARTVNVTQVPNGPPEVAYLEISPERVLQPTTTGPITLALTDPADIDKVEIAFTTGDFISLAKIASYKWSVSVEATKLLQNYKSGEPQVFVGYLDTYKGASRIARYNLFLMVRSNLMPDVAIQNLGPNMQMSNHVFNLRHDTLFLGGTTSTFSTVWNAIQPTVQTTIGQRDFNALVGQVGAIANRTGGSILAFPNAGFFDLANKGTVHEIGHKWLAFSNHPLLNASPHWAPGNAADGIEGFSVPGGQGLEFPFHLEPGSLSTTTKVCRKPAAREFNELELYKMGLVSSFLPVLQFSDQAKTNAWLLNTGIVPDCGTSYAELDIPSKYVTFSDVIATDGPTPPATQTSFTLGTTVLSAGRLYTSNEMAYFEYMAARGEGTLPVQVWEGFSAYTSQPFYAATGGRMTLSTKIR